MKDFFSSANNFSQAIKERLLIPKSLQVAFAAILSFLVFNNFETLLKGVLSLEEDVFMVSV